MKRALLPGVLLAALLGALLNACDNAGDAAPQAPAEAAPLTVEDMDAMGRALEAMQAREYGAVAEILKPMLDRAPPPADALYVAGSAAYELQNYAEAVRMLGAAVTAKPAFVPNSSALGFAHQKLGEFDQASAAFAAIVAVAPQSHKAHYGLGLVALDQGRLEEARTHLEHALALKPDYLKARFHMARLLHEEERLEEARDALAGIVEDWPSHEEALYRYARVLSALGDAADAERVMARHAEVYAAKEQIGALVAQQRAGEDSAELRQKIVTLWLHLGERVEAYDTCRAGLVAYPDDAGLDDLLQRIRALR